MIPLLSVIVPIYNVEPYLAECLKSLAAQTLEDLEVVLVDDGSVDGSRRVAEDFAASDDRFVLIGQRNLGPGPARNQGIRQARGAYLAFADGDDVVPPEAYERLVGKLTETGSDLACGAVRRLVDGELQESVLHEKVFRRPQLCTHITDKQVLVRDRTVWNKVYRRGFWERAGLEFPSGIYEDVPVAMQAHVLATSVDMVGQVVYHWRKREEGETSITQRRSELPNLAERLAAIRAVRAFLDDRAPELLDGFDALVLEKDTIFLFQALEHCEEDPGPLLELGHSWMAALGPHVLDSAPSLRRLELHLLRRGLVAELRTVREFRRGREDVTRVVPRGLRSTNWYGDYPFFRDRRLRIPDEVFDAREELKLIARVESCEWTGAEYRLRAHVGIHRVDRKVPKVNLWLSDGDRRVPLETRRRGRYGVVAAFDPHRLEGGGPWRLQVRAEMRGLVLKNWARDGESGPVWRFSVPGWSRSGMDIPQ
ncbi:glycosyltransferase family 2 protein [Nonomuraea gerenzanensis]|uniref:CDP-glycerol:poly(Glycerophosphate) glycerophosphotransferase n=1 Tax=Nonomuraea gerenzanensis TaxID=93944 RepID=A0A1M4E011_9ACTN|nr:glycosyltransferase family 2 protein [Nonomuraea gerenzanensis]UBU14438.1 glycosyltransferase [Nonomuraea gerenzanensis]SBO92153.1 CDP-glycerol:poly(glycerophosphate) glycerophosphotransferase [Nonomuraea gerenzanensis]